MKEYTRETISGIGRIVNKDHATVLNGLKKADIYFETDDKFRKQYIEIENIVLRGGGTNDVAIHVRAWYGQNVNRKKLKTKA